MAKKKITPTIDNIAQLQQTALARLHLRFTGDVHALLLDLLEKLQLKLLQHADEDGVIPPNAASTISDLAAIAWREAFNQFETRFYEVRRDAAWLAFSTIAVHHEYFFGLVDEDTLGESLLSEADPVATFMVGDTPLQVGAETFFEPQLKELLDVTAERVYSDGFKLSQRIWRLDQDGLATIQGIIRETIAEGDSAWNAAKRLEVALGAGQDCPRWTSTRLGKLTKADIAAGNTTGLIRGHPCASKGVSYNALRLARNEIQIAHAAATDVVFGRLPWVEFEKVNLNPQHPDIDCQCPDVANGGKNGDGVYPKGTISVPLHIQCGCFKTAVLMKDDDFVKSLRGWMRSESKWPAMDTYASWVKATRDTVGSVLVGTVAEQLMLPLWRWLTGGD